MQVHTAVNVRKTTVEIELQQNNIIFIISFAKNSKYSKPKINNIKYPLRTAQQQKVLLSCVTSF